MSRIWAAIASDGFKEELKREIEFKKLSPKEELGDLFVFHGEAAPLAWARVVWLEAHTLSVASIGDAAKKLRPLAKKWRHFSLDHHRRGTLILEQVREGKLPELNFPAAQEPSGAGGFALLAPDRILYSTKYDRPDPLGEVKFAEDKTAPSRAYLKLWEAFSLLGHWPVAGEITMDLGSHPGGWTWVLAKLGARVKSFDRQPLDAAVAAMPGVEFIGGDAFQATPGKIGQVDWLCSDLICYPEKLLEFVNLWIASGKARHMLCTIKMQGAPDPAVIAEFEKLGRVLHLQHNKHELTWIYGRWPPMP